MTIDTNTMVSISEANQNFSKVARLVDECGSAVILKNNVPRYLVIDFSKADKDMIASDDDVLSISKLMQVHPLRMLRHRRKVLYLYCRLRLEVHPRCMRNRIFLSSILQIP